MWVLTRSQNVEASLHVLHLVIPHLPAKPLFRLRCVSPWWNDCISSQFFIHSHSLHPRPISSFFFHHRHCRRRHRSDTSYESDSKTPAYVPLDCANHALPDPTLSFLPGPVVVAASTRGLLCCRGRAFRGYYVCNPTTTAWVALPPPTNDHGVDPTVALVFNGPVAPNVGGNDGGGDGGLSSEEEEEGGGVEEEERSNGTPPARMAVVKAAAL